MPFTPAVQACFAMDEAIREFLDLGGFAARTAMYRERSALIRNGFADLGLRMPIARKHRSHSVNLLLLPAGVTYDVLRDELKRAGYVINAGQGPLAGVLPRLHDGRAAIVRLGQVPRRPR